jgi:6-phosphogluconolactonase
MTLEVLADAESAARHAAGLVAAEARAGRFTVAVSGGRSPWLMLQALGELDLPWQHVHVLQVDERIAPDGDADRNLTHMRESLLAPASLDPKQIHPMPVNAADLDDAAARYAATMIELAGSPPALDLIHLGLGGDGHTASLVPGDPVLDVADRDVALTREYQGRRRMTLTYPAINRARRLLWLVTGEDKAAALARLRAGDRNIPAGRVRQNHAVVVADRAAVSETGRHL